MKKILLPGIVVLGLAVLSGCTDSGPAHRGGAAAPAGKAQDGATASGSASAGSAAGTSNSGDGSDSAGSASTSRCRTADLTVAQGGTDSSSGHRSVVLKFTNTGSASCRLRGYPGVAALNSAGKQVAQAERTLHGYEGGLASGQPPVVTLSPGQTASALLEAMAYQADGSSCSAYAGLLVTAPDAERSTRMRWSTDACSELEVHPVVPGTDGRTGH